MRFKPNTPVLQYSITLLLHYSISPLLQHPVWSLSGGGLQRRLQNRPMEIH